MQPLPPAGYTTTHLLFEDRFRTPSLDTTKWHPWLGDAGGRWSNNGQFPAPYSGHNSPHIHNVQYDDPFPYGHRTPIGGGHLGGEGWGELVLLASPSTYFPPWTWASAAVSSYGLMELPAAGGYVQVMAKMPDSRYGGWACIWMMAPGAPEIDLMESGFVLGATPVNRVVLSTVHTPGAVPALFDSGMDLTAGYCLYGMEYRPGQSIKMYFNGILTKTYTVGIPAAGPRYALIIDLEMMGPGGTGWHSVANVAVPGPFIYKVSDVQFYRLP